MDSNNKKTKVFLSLLLANQRRINSYILSLVPNFNDADDIMQETAAVMWKKFEGFEVGTDFAAWGLKVAHYCILEYRKKKGKDRLVFSEKIFQQISNITCQTPDKTDDRINHLRHCIEKLKPGDQRLLRGRYELNCNASNLAAQLDRSTQYIYKHLARIHHSLNLCVKRALRQEGVL
jgi:RNA polymerase sigma-70 factor (ECF subfamily)